MFKRDFPRAFCVFALIAGIWVGIAVLSPGSALGTGVFRAGSYNVENLFDLEHDGTEYPGYIPGSKYGWNSRMLAIKAGNIARVLVDLDAHVIALQEVESLAALEYLRDVLRTKGLDYPWAAVTEKDAAAVRCALLSRYPITESRDIVVPGRKNRNILSATIEIDGKPLVLFVNHWRSRGAPESLRLTSAKVLSNAVSELPPGTDYILVGDFNANYNEFEIIQTDDRVNDTDGKTGINHVLNTIFGGRLIDPGLLQQHPEKHLHYNLWLELEEGRRWSYLFHGRPRTLDNMLLPAALYDDAGISYLANSFDKFDPHYLFRDGRIFRWQRANRGRGVHLGKGYSDHLPIYACFTTEGFEPSDIEAPCYPDPVPATIFDLYASKTGAVRYKIENAAVVYKHRQNAVIKQKDGRAIYIYGAAAAMEQGKFYSMIVNRLHRYYGNLQVTGIESLEPVERNVDTPRFLLTDTDADLQDAGYENEIISRRIGHYADGWFYYLPDKAIRVFFRDKAFAPVTSGPVAIANARIGFYRTPQIVIEEKSQIQTLD